MTTTTTPTTTIPRRSRKPGWLAVGAGTAVLAIIAASTAAYLHAEDGEDAPHTFTTGALEVELTSTGTWERNGEAIDLESALIVPGDTLVYSGSSYDVTMKGSTLLAVATLDAQEAGVGTAGATLLSSLDVRIDVDGDGTIDGGSSAAGGQGRINLAPTGAETRVETLSPVITIHVPWELDHGSGFLDEIAASIQPTLVVDQVSELPEEYVGEIEPAIVADGATVHAYDGAINGLPAGTSGTVSVGWDVELAEWRYVVSFEHPDDGPSSREYGAAGLTANWGVD